MSNVRMSRRPRLRALGKTSGSVGSIRWFAGKRLAANRNKPSNGPSARLTVARRPGRDGRRYIAQLIEFGLVLISPDSVGRMDITVLAHSWAVAFPSVWFAGVIELAIGHTNREALGLALLALLMMAIVLPVLFRSWAWFLSVFGVLFVASFVLGHLNNRRYSCWKPFQEE